MFIQHREAAFPKLCLPFVTRNRRGGGDTGEDFIHARPVHAGGTLGDGGAVRGVVELRGEGGGDEAVHGDVLAGGKVPGLAGDGFWQFDVERHGAGIIGADSRGGKTSMPSARAGVRWRRLWVVGTPMQFP